jgi:hypothetical protein
MHKAPEQVPGQAAGHARRDEHITERVTVESSRSCSFADSLAAACWCLLAVVSIDSCTGLLEMHQVPVQPKVQAAGPV